MSTYSKIDLIYSLKEEKDFYQFLKNIDIKLINIDLVKDLLNNNIMEISVDDPFFKALKKLDSNEDNIKQTLEFLSEKNLVKIQDKYLSFIEDDIKELKGKNSWADTITTVMGEIAGRYELEMDKEIRQIYL